MPASSPLYDVTTFGEGLLRLSSSRYERLEQANVLDVYVAGESVEVAVGVSRLGLRSLWLSTLADNPLGRKIAGKVQEQGVDISRIHWAAEGRNGLYYSEPGSAPRTTHLIYDREASAFSRMQDENTDWSVLRESRIFHVDGAVPVLYPACVERLETAFASAQEADCLISVCMDEAIRSPEDWQRAMPLLEHAQLMIVSQRAARLIETADSPEALADRLKTRFGLTGIAVTDGLLPTPRTGEWQAVAVGDRVYRDRTYRIEVVDAAGALSAFTSGFLYGYLKEGVGQGLLCGNAAAALAHSIPGNLLWIGEEDIMAQIRGGGATLQR